MNNVEYIFGDFRLKLAERELWKQGVLQPVTRLVFDSIAYLIDHRDRAVGRDEIVSAVWGRVDVSDGHLNQVIVRARRVLGDDGQAQQAIRTVPGFGYRWIGDVHIEVVSEADHVAERPVIESPYVASAPSPVVEQRGSEAEASIDPPANVAGPIEHPGAGRVADRPVRRYAMAAIILVAVGFTMATLLYPSRGSQVSMPVQPALSEIAGDAIVVLPVIVEGPAEAGWVGLGAMDLVADRLRQADLPVPPSETVVTALHGLSSPLAPADMARVRKVLGAGVVVQGKAILSGDGWTVQLATKNSTDDQQRAEAHSVDVIHAARAAADLLLVALGRKPPDRIADESGETGAEQERLQQARVAMLTSQLDLARSILANSSATAKASPDARILLGEVELRAGRLDQSADAIAALLADPLIQGNPLRRARVLMLRGNLNMRRSAFDEARPDFDAAINELGSLIAPLDMGDALTRRGLLRTWSDDFDGAAADFTRARPLAEQAGDRLRVAHVDAGFGQLQIQRQRLDLALPYLDAAIDQYEAFGVVDRAVTLRNLLNDTYASLLRWPEALVISERQWALHDRFGGDPGLAVVITNRRGRLLIALGRYREAEALLREAQQRYAGVRPEARRYLYDLAAELASHQGHHEAVISAVEQALQTWPRDPSYDRYAYLVLLRQRALIASGLTASEPIERWLPADGGEGVSVIFRVALAEWAAQQGNEGMASERYDRAMKAAEAVGTPALVALVAQSYAEWLLAQKQLEKAAELAGRVAVWARQDFDCALLRVKVFHALGRRDTWSLAVEQAMELAGERAIPESLRAPPRSR